MQPSCVLIGEQVLKEEVPFPVMVHAFVVVLSHSFRVLLKKSLMLKFPVPVAALLLVVPPPPLVLTVTPNQHFNPWRVIGQNASSTKMRKCLVCVPMLPVFTTPM